MNRLVLQFRRLFGIRSREIRPFTPRAGDIGLVRNPALFGRIVDWGQQLDDGDPARYTHAFIFTGNPDEIFQSSLTIGLGSVNHYIGDDFLLIRHNAVSPFKYNQSMASLNKLIGKVYPVHRLFLHLFDALCSRTWRTFSNSPLPFRLTTIPSDWPVCSELAAMFIVKSGSNGGWVISDGKGWSGVNPDHIDDARQAHPELWTTVYEGKLI